MRIFTLLMTGLILAAIVYGWQVVHSPEAVAARCIRYDLDRTFDDCLKSKPCSYRAGRLAERREYIAYLSNTYDCPRNRS